MLETLSNYKHNCFEFTVNDNLKDVCNAPTDKSGVYIVFGCIAERKLLIYIGRSGKKVNGTIVHRVAGLGGLKDRIVNGHQFGKISRKKSWPTQMIQDSIESLLIYWFDTQDDDPVDVEHSLLCEYEKEFGWLPAWNKTK